MRFAWLIAVLLTSVLAGCLPINRYHGITKEDRPRYDVLLNDPQAMRSFVADTTLKSFDHLYGTQIEYHSADGRVWLVFPGNPRTVHGYWKIKGEGYDAKLCYRYPYGRDAITGNSGVNWLCPSIRYFLKSDELVDGDVMGLRQRGARPYPYILPEDQDVSISEMMRAFGRGPLTARNKTFARSASQ